MNRDEKEIIEQDRTQKEQHPGGVFIIHLLMKGPSAMPEKSI